MAQQERSDNHARCVKRKGNLRRRRLTGAQRVRGPQKVTWGYRKTRPCGRRAAALGFALAEQELEGQFHVILAQHLFDGACLQFLR
jgi:hypothetical protein